jgi:O-antigen/teichoic acid export membrane protein
MTASAVPRPTVMRQRYSNQAKHRSPSKTDIFFAPMVGAIAAVIVSTGVTAATGYVFWSRTTSHLAAATVGQTTSLVAAFTAVSLFVGQPIGVTLVARLPRSGYQRGLLITALRTTGFRCVAISSIVIIALPHISRHFMFAASPLTGTLFVAAATTQALGLVLDQASIGIRFARVMSQRNAAQGVLKLGFLSLLLASIGSRHLGPDFVLAVWTSANFLSIAWAVLSCRRRCSNECARKSRAALRKELNKQSMWQTVASLCGSLPPQILPLLVAAQIGPTASGEFSLTWQVGAACYVISPAVASALLAELSHENIDSRRRIGIASLIIAGLLAPMDLFLVIFGKFFLHYFGNGVATAGYGLLIILVVSTFPDAVTNIAVSVYRSQEQLRRAAAVNAIIAAMVLGSTSFLLSKQGIYGAGYAWLAGEVAGTWLLPLIGYIPDRSFATAWRPGRSRNENS